MTERLRGSDGRFISKADHKAITAAASVLPIKTIERLPRMASAWQEQAWRLWRMLGVLHFPTSAKAKQVGRLGWNVIVNGEQLEPEAALEAMKAVTAPLSVREAAKRIALNIEVAGEVFYARASDEWKVYAATTPNRNEILKSADIVVRGLQPDPVNPDEPDSAVRAALATADAIRLMCAMSRSQDRNRLAQRGILLVPKEGSFPEKDTFQSDLEESMVAPISDEYAPSAVVPLKVEFPGEHIEQWRHLVLESPYDDKLMDRIDKTIGQLALELDMAPEVLLGNMDSNHWNAWLSDETNYRAYVEPLGELTGEVFAQAMMAAVEGAVIEVTPDPAAILLKSPSISDTFEGAKLGAVGLEFVRAALGADEDDAPDESDIELILRMQGISTADAQPVDEPVDEAPAEPDAIAAAASSEDQALDELGDRLADIDQHLLLRLNGAADLLTIQVRRSIDGAVGLQEAVAGEVDALVTSWRRLAAQGRKALQGLGIEAKGPEWDLAQTTSEEILADGMTAWLTANIEKPPSELPELPMDLFREVLAAAGGSDTAVVSALTKPRGILPQPTPADPQAFASGVLTSRELRKQGLVFKQWRWRYGSALREQPFLHHKAQNGRFTDDNGTVAGWYCGDHKGCRCGLAPVWRRERSPNGVSEEVSA